MRQELHDLVAQIKGIDSAGERHYGTGFLIKKDRILTARHVIENCDKIEVRLIQSYREQWFPASLVWPSKEYPSDLDVALLKVTIDSGITEKIPEIAWRFLLSTHVPDKKCEWETRGIPDAGNITHNGKTTSNPVDFGGIAYPSSTDGKMSLDLSARPDEPKDWGGASGSPVFIDHTIRGVIISYSQAFKGRKLEALSVQRMCRENGFWKELGLEEDASYVERVRAELRERLVDLKDGAKGLLFNSLVKQSEIPSPKNTPDELIDQLFNMDVVKLLLVCYNVRSQLQKPTDDDSKEKRKIAESYICQIVNWIMPLIVNQEWVTSVALRVGDMTAIKVPFYTFTIADVVMARLDRRCVDIRKTKLDNYRGVGAVEVYGESAAIFNVFAANVFQELVVNLKMELRIDIKNITDDSLKRYAACIDRVVESFANPTDPDCSRRYLFLEFDKISEDFAKKLKELLPHLLILIKDEFGSPDEHDIRRNLIRLQP